MGDMADGILDGIFDEETGEFIDDELSMNGGPGYPRSKNKSYYKKPKRNLKHALKGQSVGGLHLVGKSASIEGFEDCVITDYVGKRGNRRYILTDKAGKTHKVKFSQLKIIKT